jgi:molybdate transport system substrate-binding protein
MRRIALTIAGLVLMAGAGFAQTPAPKISEAGPNDLRVLAVTSIREPLVQGLAGAEKATGRHIVIETGTAFGNLKDMILGGQDFEVALLLPVVNAELAKAGKILPGETNMGSATMGFGLHGDAKVDVSTPEALRKTLIGAKAVIFSPTSSGTPANQKLMSDLKLNDSLIKHKNSATPPVTLGPGEYEIYLYPLSEIILEKGWKNLGPYPESARIPVVVTAVTGTHARDKAATKALMDYLASPAMTAILAKNEWKR